jgi:hypothetical protein
MKSDSTLLARWPDHLVERVSRRDFVLVVGAGISAGCMNAAGDQPPGWSELLRQLILKFAGGAKAKTECRAMLQANEYLDLAERLLLSAQNNAKERDFYGTIAEATDGPAGGHFRHSSVHDQLVNLEPKFIVTTNYDKILERATLSGYGVHAYGSSTLGSEVRGGRDVIIKIHGSVDEPQNMVLSRSDYARIRRDGQHVLDVVQALFTVYPALFVGYSFSDPDVQLLLENVVRSSTNTTSSHYLLMDDTVPAYLKRLYANSYSASVISYAQGDFVEMERMLALLGQRALAIRTGAVPA